jgi:hypothetical protein
MSETDELQLEVVFAGLYVQGRGLHARVQVQTGRPEDAVDEASLRPGRPVFRLEVKRGSTPICTGCDQPALSAPHTEVSPPAIALNLSPILRMCSP